MGNILGPLFRGMTASRETQQERERQEERQRQQKLLFELQRERAEVELQLSRANMEDAELIRPLKKRLSIVTNTIADLTAALPGETVTAQPTEGLPGAQPTGLPPITGGMPGAGATPRLSGPGPQPTPNLMDILRMGGTGGGAGGPSVPFNAPIAGPSPAWSRATGAQGPPLLMPGMAAGGRPGMPRGPIQFQSELDPQGRPAAGSALQATELGRLMAEQAALKGELTPERAAEMGLTGPEQWSPFLRRKMEEERTPVAQEAFELDRYGKLMGIDQEEARLDLAERTEARLTEYAGKAYSDVPESDKYQAAQAKARLEMQIEADFKLARIRQQGQDRRAKAGGAGGGKEPITLTSVNVEVGRLRRQVFGGYDEATDRYVPGLPEGPEREAATAELAWWRQYRELLGGPPAGAEEREEGANWETPAGLRKMLADLGPLKFRTEAKKHNYDDESINAIIGGAGGGAGGAQ